ncbi:bifunctional diaminohydroxyphosphoribosylaminopyrimidine deaminase/5-amino-6-(5-phosphoribosylamino)uracil reductase RibD [Leucobacter japonicus]|uniref:bifunctional diaminohydroxyphosphoribosylaminopyrimidine deaminase/5-amino-6-(5-phosphoribosylamino)uracil reductase RibD n=1 Tax=Leucobacter japonicus TaxID=1461259 RepID=UPI0006A7BC6B|nr:bifunctional diaminohydroxyphosphoribosylaminopyrimidine deaminase/5-amino-6-(5-phosphoribosylamino)uracil reductase RibD [Leucobacter japonicus]
MLDQSLIEDGMRRGLTIARRGPSDTPNPQVGCVLLDPEGRIVAEGWHRGAGTPHAEVDAIAHLPTEWRSRTRELTAVVTLEPCNHTGRTGPCAVALVELGVGAVAYALSDPGQASSGGADTLRAAGIEVRGDVLPGEARALLGPWLAAQGGSGTPGTAPEPTDDLAAARPRVVVKWAQTLDGRAAATDGSSQWITGPEARADVHVRRAAADAILIGTGTLLADDPTLTARDAHGDLLVPAASQPIPVVLGHRVIPEAARLRQHPALAAHGLAAPIQLTGDDLAADLAALAAHGIHSVFVEGGPAVASALLAAGLADEVLVYVAPALLGGPKLAIGDLGIPNIDAIARLSDATTTALGDDLLVTARLAARPDTPLHPDTALHAARGTSTEGS